MSGSLTKRCDTDSGRVLHACAPPPGTALRAAADGTNLANEIANARERTGCVQVDSVDSCRANGLMKAEDADMRSIAGRSGRGLNTCAPSPIRRPRVRHRR